MADLQEVFLGEVLLAGLDLAFAMIRRYSVIYLLCGVLSAEDGWTKSKKRVSAGFMAVTTVFYLICSYLPAAQRLLYGNREGMQASRASILPMALSLALMLAYCCFFYPGKKSRIFYLVFTAYTVNELVAFMIHPLFSLLLGTISGVIEHFVI